VLAAIPLVRPQSCEQHGARVLDADDVLAVWRSVKLDRRFRRGDHRRHVVAVERAA